MARNGDGGFSIGGRDIAPGERLRMELPVVNLYTSAPVALPVVVQRGHEAGPTLFVSAALHGDEIIGVEIIRRLLRMPALKDLHGTLLAVPIVNTLAFLHQSRYLPDRRDLNRSFPGSARGSLASRLAHLFMTEIVRPCALGIDFHTGSLHRTNLPHIRANLDEPETRRLAEAFGARVMINAKTRDGSLREVASRDGTRVLLFEAGAPQRFNEFAIEAGLAGTLRVMAALEMIEQIVERAPTPAYSPGSSWVRARRGGIYRRTVGLGDTIAVGQSLGLISDAFGEMPVTVRAHTSGIVIGHTLDPLASQGDGLVHIADIEAPGR
jgi:predicted deacylase